MSQNLSPLFSKGIQDHFGIAYALYPSQIPQIFNMRKMDGRYTDEQLWEMYQLPVRRSPGTPVAQSQFQPSFAKRYIPVTYALGDVIAQEDWDDDQYGVIARVLPSKGGALARSHATLREIVCANFFKNIAFAVAGNNTPGTSDGRPIFDLSHPVSLSNPSQVYANKPSVAVDFSTSAYQAAQVNLMTQYAANNVEIIRNNGRKLVHNPTERYVVSQVLKGDWQPYSADLTDNKLVQNDNIEPVCWPYWQISGANGAATNAYNAWMLLGEEHMLNFLTRQEVEIHTDYAVNSLAYVFASMARFAVGATDWRGLFASIGN